MPKQNSPFFCFGDEPVQSSVRVSFLCRPRFSAAARLARLLGRVREQGRLRRCTAPCGAPGEGSGGCVSGEGACSAELRSGGDASVRLEPRERGSRGQGGSVEGCACPSLPQPDKTVREVFEAERASLVPQAGPFEDHRSASARASTTCLVQFDNNRYSAEASAAGGPVEVRAYAERVEIWHECRKAGEHARGFGRGGTVYDPLHYLPALRRKPGALRNGAPFKNWDLCLDSTHVGLSGVFPPVRFGVQDIRLFRGVHRRFLSLGYGDLVVRFFSPGKRGKPVDNPWGAVWGFQFPGMDCPHTSHTLRLAAPVRGWRPVNRIINFFI